MEGSEEMRDRVRQWGVVILAGLCLVLLASNIQLGRMSRQQAAHIYDLSDRVQSLEKSREWQMDTNDKLLDYIERHTDLIREMRDGY